MKKLVSLLTAALMAVTVIVPSSSNVILAEETVPQITQTEEATSNPEEEIQEVSEEAEESSDAEAGIEETVPAEAEEDETESAPVETNREEEIKKEENIKEAAPQAEGDFYDDFGDTPDAEINLGNWGYLVGGNGLVKRDPEATDAQNGKGYSFYTDGAAKLFIEHKFGNDFRGKISADFYDDGVFQVGRMAQVNVTGIANVNNQNKPYIIGLGINQNHQTQGWSDTNYCARIADDGRFIDTKIARTKDGIRSQLK